MISKSAATAMMAATAVPAIFRALMSIFHLARPSFGRASLQAYPGTGRRLKVAK
jgi:hypothetical protein